MPSHGAAGGGACTSAVLAPLQCSGRAPSLVHPMHPLVRSCRSLPAAAGAAAPPHASPGRPPTRGLAHPRFLKGACPPCPAPPPVPPCPAAPQHFGYLVTKRKLEEEDSFEDHVNRHSASAAALRRTCFARSSPLHCPACSRPCVARRRQGAAACYALPRQHVALILLGALKMSVLGAGLEWLRTLEAKTGLGQHPTPTPKRPMCDHPPCVLSCVPGLWLCRRRLRRRWATPTCAA